jgi:hypothetical protein
LSRARSEIAALVALLALSPLGTPRAAGARVLVTVDEALALAFPGAAIERATVYLKPEQVERARSLAGGDAKPPAIVRPYRATRDGKLVGTAYFDVHLVRTLQETVMVVVAPDGRVGRVETISFDEPPDYLPREAWYLQFDGKALDPELELRRAIRPVTGATLTARATTDAVRRVLALHKVLEEDAVARKQTAAAATAAEPDE